jgi:NodT family efflux transporter outer membrane factor (OMF) lipoprotein
MPHRRRPAAALALALAVAGCALGPKYQPPAAVLTRPYLATPPASPPGLAAPALEAWWQGFSDPELTIVVERAEAGNQDIAQALARLRQSQALARGAGAALLPSASADAQGQGLRQSLDSPIGAIGRHLPGFRRDTGLYDLGAGAAWDPDLFGGLRRGREAAVADAREEAAQAEAVRLAVIAEAADAYLTVRACQERLGVARRQEATQTDLVSLLARQEHEGVAPERELRQTRAALEGVQATIPPLTAALETSLDRLDVLMGAQPGTWRSELTTAAPVPAPPVLTLGDGPADLMRRRPDVLAAEQRLIASNARIGQAIAEYYPKVTISGALGVESLSASQLFTPAALQAAGGGALRWRLFDFGRVDAEVAQARGAQAEALAAWRATLLRASEEVEDAVVDLAQNQAKARALERQIAELTIARRQAEQAYEGGVTSLVEVRDADRDLLAAADQLAIAREGAAKAAVAAYHALGGGWAPPLRRATDRTRPARRDPPGDSRG